MGEGELEGEGVEGEAEGEGGEGGAGGEEGGDGAVVGEGGVAEHGEEVVEGEEGVGVCGDERGPRHHVGTRDSAEQGQSIVGEVGFEVLRYEVVPQRNVCGAGNYGPCVRRAGIAGGTLVIETPSTQIGRCFVVVISVSRHWSSVKSTITVHL